MERNGKILIVFWSNCKYQLVLSTIEWNLMCLFVPSLYKGKYFGLETLIS